MAEEKKKKKGLKGFFDKVMYDKSSADALEDDLYNKDTYVSEDDFYGDKEEDKYGEGSDAAKYSADEPSEENSDSLDDYLGENDSGASYSSITKGKLGKSKNIITLRDFTWKMYVTLIIEILLLVYTFYVLIFL